MNFKQEIADFILEKCGGITVISAKDHKIAYADCFFTDKFQLQGEGQDADQAYPWMEDCPPLALNEPAVQWEYYDLGAHQVFRVLSSLFEKENQLWQLHFFSDISEYMDLNRDMTKYMAFFKELSSFQSAVLEKLSTTYYELLPMLADYFKSGAAYFLIRREDNLDIISYDQAKHRYSNDRTGIGDVDKGIFSAQSGTDFPLDGFSPKIREIFLLNGATESDSYIPLCTGSISGQEYAVCLAAAPTVDRETFREKTLMNVIRLYIENGIMQEKLRYDSEHDSLTGLFNKGKYLDMVQNQYQTMHSIAIFNFDVNNLKVMNDTYGHEAGDRLLIKAADSIRKVTNDRVHGYRMGGDEYLMIACDTTPEETDELKARWEQELARLNTLDDSIDCVIAVGVAFGSQGYDFAALMKEADGLMYEDKKRKKKPGEEIR